MKKGFEWQTDLEDEAWEAHESEPHSQRRRINPIWLMLLIPLVAAGLLAGWLNERQQVGKSDEALRQDVQEVLDAEREAFLNGDGDLFFTMFADEPAWRAAQLRPENMDAIRAERTAITAELHGDFVWADVAWEENGRLHQHITFFERQDGQLVQVATDSDYWGNWGELVSSRYDWGELTYAAKDEPFVDEMAKTIAALVDEACAVDCVAEQLPFNVAVMPDFSQTAKPHTIHIPSPRLLGLDEEGAMDENGRFHQQLRQSIYDYLTPATIRFALPPIEADALQHLLNYEQAAADFTAANPQITVELVYLDELPDDLATLADFDGAAIPPTADMIAAGLVRDLTDLAGSDRTFEASDFYEKVWQTAVWRDRLWFAPHTAAFQLLYYDSVAYRLADQPEPSWQWNWTEMEADMVAMVAAQPPQSRMDWAFLDIGRDSLLAYAYSESNRCQVDCPAALQPQHIQAALEWHDEIVRQAYMPDISGMTVAEREQFMWNNQSANRRAAIWVGKPALYEYYVFLDTLGAAPFPGQDAFNGSTPLWGEGSFISTNSERPSAVWQWIVFLSKEQPLASSRHVPARPSAAAETKFWETLPPDLGNAMRAAFNNARPVTLEDKLYFSPEQITAVVDGELTAVEAAQIKPRINWFGMSSK